MSDYLIVLRQDNCYNRDFKPSVLQVSFLEAASCFVVIQIIHIYKSRLTASKNLHRVEKRNDKIGFTFRMHIRMSVVNLLGRSNSYYIELPLLSF